ncbi:MAG: hypothetical protein A2W25_04490 [candidate division Zixibacteria bacterium RBG_16_53_22]|nr:MAG: hypothetical protein A2W25_04490 [candidate division Zixibacteria bacterium RBG_16_53_22]
MKKVVMFVGLVFLVLASSALAKKEKTVTRQDTVVTDSKYGYSFVVDNNWKVKDFKEPSVERAFLEKKNYSVNREAQAFGGDYTIPTVVIFAQEFNGAVGDFEALLRKSLDEHSSDNEIIQKLNLLRDSEYVISNDLVIDSKPARQVFLKRNYKRLLSPNAYSSESRVERQAERFINDHEVHELFLIKIDNMLYVFQAFCEREFFAKENRDEFESIANSLKF